MKKLPRPHHAARGGPERRFGLKRLADGRSRPHLRGSARAPSLPLPASTLARLLPPSPRCPPPDQRRSCVHDVA
eukprot:364609-Chlamydomonas_euryale.AAC.3